MVRYLCYHNVRIFFANMLSLGRTMGNAVLLSYRWYTSITNTSIIYMLYR